MGCQTYSYLADILYSHLPDNEEKEVALRKLLEARDAAFRALLELYD